MKKSKTNKQLVTKKDIKATLSELDEEIKEEHLAKIKNKAKKLIKEIKMTEIILEKKKEQLNNILEGKVEYSEENLLFERDE